MCIRDRACPQQNARGIARPRRGAWCACRAMNSCRFICSINLVTAHAKGAVKIYFHCSNKRWSASFVAGMNSISSHAKHFPTSNQKLVTWVGQMTKLCRPEQVHWCDGSDAEYQSLCDAMMASGTFIKLNETLRPNSFLARSHPSDVARIEGRTFICAATKDEAGPTNNWADPVEMKRTMRERFEGCMKGRTLYVIPFAMGPLGSPICKIGIQITDSPYVVVNMKIMTHMGSAVLELSLIHI